MCSAATQPTEDPARLAAHPSEVYPQGGTGVGSGRRAGPRGAAAVADPRTGFLTLSAIVGVLAAVFLAMVGGHAMALPVPMAAISIALFVNRRGGPLRAPLAVVQALLLGLITLPLMLNGSGVITLIGCLAAVVALFYRDPDRAEPPSWLQTRRVHGRRRPTAAGPADVPPNEP